MVLKSSTLPANCLLTRPREEDAVFVACRSKSVNEEINITILLSFSVCDDCVCGNDLPSCSKIRVSSAAMICWWQGFLQEDRKGFVDK